MRVGAELASIDVEGDHKMIRIQTADNLGGITIAIDGQLAGEYVEEVETSMRKAIEQHKDVHLFLRDVSHIDETGHSLLSRMAAQGVELSAAGLYSSYGVTQIQRALSSRQSRGKCDGPRHRLSAPLSAFDFGNCRNQACKGP